jgi:hypothetical protein
VFFFCSPERHCRAPGRNFTDSGKAMRWAQMATNQYRIGYVVWGLDQGRPRRVRTFYPTTGRRS